METKHATHRIAKYKDNKFVKILSYVEQMTEYWNAGKDYRVECGIEERCQDNEIHSIFENDVTTPPPKGEGF